jgi:hypothetical protein
MALPTTITGFAELSVGGRNVSRPFLSSGGNVYVVGWGSTLTLLRAFKATDPTDSFSNIGTDVTLENQLQVVSAIQDGDLIHVTTFNAAATTAIDLRYHTFNMATDEWVITNELVVENFGVVSNAVYVGHVDITVRSDGDVIILYNGQSQANMGSQRERVYYARREGGSWTVDVAVDDGGGTHWYASGIVAGASDRSHFFFIDDGAGDGYQRTLTSANALESFPSSYDSTVDLSEGSHSTLGTSYDSGGTIKVRMPVPDADAVTLNSVKLDSADTPTVSQDDDITGATAQRAGAYAACFAVDGTTLWNVFLSSGDDGVYVQSNADDAGWSTPDLFYDGGIHSTVKANVYTRSGSIVAGMITFVATSCVYHEYVIEAGSDTTDADFDMDAAASLTWNATSTATAAMDADAAASLTWNATATASSDWSSAAAAALTWAGAEVLAASATDWESTAAATLTWDSQAIHSASWSAAAAATLTWNGIATASADLDSDAAADLQWNATSTAASALSTTALANLTWDGASLAHAMFLVWPANATLNWNGAAIAVSEASFDMDAAADLTWNGTSVVAASWSAAAGIVAGAAAGAAIASADLQVTTLASITWNGITTAGAAFDADALAALTWNSVEIFSAAFDSDAAASLTWTGASIATINSAFSMAAASSVTWNGAVVLAADWDSDAAASLQATGAATAASPWSSAAAGTLTWDAVSDAGAAWSAAATAALTMAGVEVAAASWTIAAAATLTFEGQEVGGSGSFDMAAAASVTFGGEDATPAVALDPITRDGWLVNAELARELEEEDEEDILLMLTAAVAYMEQADAY